MEIPSMLEDKLMEIPQCEDISFDQQFVVFTNVLNNLWKTNIWWPQCFDLLHVVSFQLYFFTMAILYHLTWCHTSSTSWCISGLTGHSNLKKATKFGSENSEVILDPNKNRWWFKTSHSQAPFGMLLNPSVNHGINQLPLPQRGNDRPKSWSRPTLKTNFRVFSIGSQRFTQQNLGPKTNCPIYIKIWKHDETCIDTFPTNIILNILWFISHWNEISMSLPIFFLWHYPNNPWDWYISLHLP